MGGKVIATSHKKWSARLKDKTKRIITQITEASPFYEAESYHQKYLEKTGQSCHISRSPFK
jgi:peptide methionine sulfoxide reductase MsrA